MIIIIMGVAGSGKTTVAQVLAAALNWEFHDADEFHPAARRKIPACRIGCTPQISENVFHLHFAISARICSCRALSEFLYSCEILRLASFSAPSSMRDGA